METTKLQELLDEHGKWVNMSGGRCADLCDADLREVMYGLIK